MGAAGMMLLVGVGVGWFFAGVAQPFSIRFGFMVMALYIAAAVGFHYLGATP